MTARSRFETGPETVEGCGPEIEAVVLAKLGERMLLCVELQALRRLPRSHAILFSIQVYLLTLDDLAALPARTQRSRRVLDNLPAAPVHYKRDP